jgi:hypothetical protein
MAEVGIYDLDRDACPTAMKSLRDQMTDESPISANNDSEIRPYGLESPYELGDVTALVQHPQTPRLTRRPTTNQPHLTRP